MKTHLQVIHRIVNQHPVFHRKSLALPLDISDAVSKADVMTATVISPCGNLISASFKDRLPDHDRLTAVEVGLVCLVVSLLDEVSGHVYWPGCSKQFW